MRYSFIIPAYNVEPYVGKCLESILEQRTDDYEIIIVYDKSPDNTRQVIETYCEKTGCIKVIDNLEKNGLSHARNVGVDNAKGDYLIFVDSDDYIHPDTLDNLDKAIEKYNEPDWIYSNGNYEFRDDENELTLKNRLPELDCLSGSTGIQMLREFVLHLGALWSVWGKAYKREFWEKLGCISDKPCREDVDMGYKILENAACAVIVPPFYCYRRARAGSLLNTFSYKQEVVFSDVMFEWLTYLEHNESLDEELKKLIKRRLNNEFCSALLPKIYYAEGEQRTDLLEKCKRLEEYFKYPFNTTDKLIGIFESIFGLRATCRVLSVLKRIKQNAQ